MKKKLIITLLSLFLFTGINQVTAQVASPPPPPGGNGANGNGSAPIGGGLVILLTMGAVYGGVKGIKFLRTEKSQD